MFVFVSKEAKHLALAHWLFIYTPMPNLEVADLKEISIPFNGIEINNYN